MENVNKLCIVITLCIICFTVGNCIGFRKAYKHYQNGDYINIEHIDTMYNKVVLDSIEYNIRVKDSVIVKLKQECEYEVEQAISANDSNAVEQFKELAGRE